MKKIKSSLTEGPILKSLLTLAFPIILANVFQAAYQLTDSFWVGRLGEKAVASVAISIPVIFLLTSLGIGFAVAGSTLTAQYFGAKKEEMVNHCAAQTLLMIAAVSLILSLAGFLFASQILNIMGVPADIHAVALRYMRVIFIGLVPNFCFFMFQSIMRSIGKPTLPVYIVIGTVILNFALDPLFMFGWNFIPRMEVSGVAFATLITQTLAAIIGFAILFSGKRGIHIKLKNLIPDKKFIKRSFLLGLPASIEQSARSLGMVVMTSLIAGFGTLAIASYGAGSNIIQLIIIVSIGLSAATAALAGQNIGAGNIERAGRIARLSMTISFIGLSIAGLLIYLFAPALIAFFVPNDPAIIAGGAAFLRVLAFSFGFIGIQMSVNAIMQASGNTLTSMIITLTSQWLLQLPLAFLLSKYTPLAINGLWYAFPITNVLISLIAFSIFKSGKWKKKRLTADDKLASEITENIETEEIVPYDA